MVKAYRLLIFIALLLVVSTTLYGRVVATSTITLYGYIPVQFNLTCCVHGKYFLTTNESSASIDYQDFGETRLFSIVMP